MINLQQLLSAVVVATAWYSGHTMEAAIYGGRAAQQAHAVLAVPQHLSRLAPQQSVCILRTDHLPLCRLSRNRAYGAIHDRRHRAQQRPGAPVAEQAARECAQAARQLWCYPL